MAGATYCLVREHGLTLAPEGVVHLPDPAALAIEAFGEARAAERMAEGDAMPLVEIVDAVRRTLGEGNSRSGPTDHTNRRRDPAVEHNRVTPRTRARLSC